MSRLPRLSCPTFLTSPAKLLEMRLLVRASFRSTCGSLGAMLPAISNRSDFPRQEDKVFLTPETSLSPSNEMHSTRVSGTPPTYAGTCKKGCSSQRELGLAGPRLDQNLTVRGLAGIKRMRQLMYAKIRFRVGIARTACREFSVVRRPRQLPHHLLAECENSRRIIACHDVVAGSGRILIGRARVVTDLPRTPAPNDRANHASSSASRDPALTKAPIREMPHRRAARVQSDCCAEAGRGRPPQRARHLIAHLRSVTSRRSTWAYPSKDATWRTHADSDRGLTAGYSGSSSDRPNGPSSTSMGGKSGGRSGGSNSPTT